MKNYVIPDSIIILILSICSCKVKDFELVLVARAHMLLNLQIKSITLRKSFELLLAHTFDFMQFLYHS